MGRCREKLLKEEIFEYAAPVGASLAASRQQHIASEPKGSRVVAVLN